MKGVYSKWLLGVPGVPNRRPFTLRDRTETDMNLPQSVVDLVRPRTVTITTDSVERFLEWSVQYANEPNTNVVLVDYGDNPPAEGITMVVIPESRFRR